MMWINIFVPIICGVLLMSVVILGVFVVHLMDELKNLVIRVNQQSKLEVKVGRTKNETDHHIKNLFSHLTILQRDLPQQMRDVMQESLTATSSDYNVD